MGPRPSSFARIRRTVSPRERFGVKEGRLFRVSRESSLEVGNCREIGRCGMRGLVKHMMLALSVIFGCNEQVHENPHKDAAQTDLQYFDLSIDDNHTGEQRVDHWCCGPDKISPTGPCSAISSTGWCTMKTGIPYLQGKKLLGVWGSRGKDVFVVGESGIILHFDGTTWVKQSSGSSNELRAVWGTGADNVYAVGDKGTILHFDGKGWKTQVGVGANLRSVWGSGPTNVFTVGKSGKVYRSDGKSWTSVQVKGVDGDLEDIWGTSNSNIFLLSYNQSYGRGDVFHFDGKTWSTSLPAHTKLLTAIWGSSTSNIFAVGAIDTNNVDLYHFDGKLWHTKKLPERSDFNSIWGNGNADIYMVGDRGRVLHHNGKAWTSHMTQSYAQLFGVWSAGLTDVFAVGEKGTILHYKH